MWDNVTLLFASGGSAFIGSAAGMFYSLKMVTRLLNNALTQDPEIEKIEIKVVMNDEVN